MQVLEDTVRNPAVVCADHTGTVVGGHIRAGHWHKLVAGKVVRQLLAHSTTSHFRLINLSQFQNEGSRHQVEDRFCDIAKGRRVDDRSSQFVVLKMQ